MITLYGKTYAKNDRDAVESLFTPGGTVNGLYRRLKGGVYLMDLQGNERAFIRKDGLGPVSVTRNDKGKRLYMFGASTADQNWLGEPDSYIEARDETEALAKFLYA